VKAQKRQELIEQRVLAQGEIGFESLAEELGVSQMTIRRDVEALEDRGVVRKVLGGAIAFGGKSVEPTFATRAAESAISKRRIAEATADLLRPGETVILDSGSTALAVARAIRERGLALTVITPSIYVAAELNAEPDTTIILTGGTVRPGELSLIGAEAETAFSSYNCDTYVMGVAGLHAERGFSDYHREESRVKKAALRSADRVIAVLDETKLGRAQLVNVASLAEVAVLVTDAAPTDPTVAAVREAGLEVVCVPGTNSTPADER
jgi:DeoR/GlpR family transcriptional regulator of sugar metabolism